MTAEIVHLDSRRPRSSDEVLELGRQDQPTTGRAAVVKLRDYIREWRITESAIRAIDPCDRQPLAYELRFAAGFLAYLADEVVGQISEVEANAR